MDRIGANRYSVMHDSANAMGSLCDASPGRLTLLIDGLCPLCKREAAWLARRDKKNRLAFVDIAAPAFDASKYGRTQDELMGAIHAMTPEGELVTGVEVFRRAYAAIGLGWLLAPTRWPVVRPIADAAYRAFARIRPRLQGRSCESGRCRV